MADLKKKSESPKDKPKKLESSTPDPNQIQVHAGNVGTLTVHFLNEISKDLKRIADILEKQDG